MFKAFHCLTSHVIDIGQKTSYKDKKKKRKKNHEKYLQWEKEHAKKAERSHAADKSTDREER